MKFSDPGNTASRARHLAPSKALEWTNLAKKASHHRSKKRRVAWRRERRKPGLIIL